MPTQIIKVVNSRTKLPLGLFILIWVIVLYMLPQKFSYIEAMSVPNTFIDQMIPLNMHWIWIYVSYYLFLCGAYLLTTSEKNANQVFYSYLASAFISTLIFFVFPTTISRELYPITETTGWSAWLLELIRSTDESLNCAPSMHIAMSTIATGTFLREKPIYRVPAILWALLIAYSTMATKQHYWWDVATGFAFGLFIFGFFDRATYVELTPLGSSKKIQN